MKIWVLITEWVGDSPTAKGAYLHEQDALDAEQAWADELSGQAHSVSSLAFESVDPDVCLSLHTVDLHGFPDLFNVQR